MNGILSLTRSTCHPGFITLFLPSYRKSLLLLTPRVWVCGKTKQIWISHCTEVGGLHGWDIPYIQRTKPTSWNPLCGTVEVNSTTLIVVPRWNKDPSQSAMGLMGSVQQHLGISLFLNKNVFLFREWGAFILKWTKTNLVKPSHLSN